MHSSLTFLYLVFCLSCTTLALALVPAAALNVSLPDLQPSPNLTASNREYHCFPTVPTRSFGPLDCSAAISIMLTTRGAAIYTTFGTAGDYQGPLSWIYGTCRIVLMAASVHSARGSLMLFAQAAAEITKTCHLFALLPYDGGSCSWVKGELTGIVVVVERVLLAAQ